MATIASQKPYALVDGADSDINKFKTEEFLNKGINVVAVADNVEALRALQEQYGTLLAIQVTASADLSDLRQRAFITIPRVAVKTTQVEKPLRDRIALVDGADSAAGATTIAELLQEGVKNVIAVVDNQAALAELQKKYGERLKVSVANPTDRDPVSTALQSLNAINPELHDNIDIFVSRTPEAVTNRPTPVENDLETTYHLDLTAKAVHHVSNIMIKHGRPSDIQVLNGVSGDHPDPKRPYLSACHKFLQTFTEGVDASLRQQAVEDAKAADASATQPEGTTKPNKNIRIGELRVSDAVLAREEGLLDVAKKTCQRIQVDRAQSVVAETMLAHGEVSQSFSVAPRTSITHAQKVENEKPTSLSNKVIAITGASDGIGKEYALKLAENDGSKIIAIGRDQAKLDALKEEFAAKGMADRLHTVKLDVSDPIAVDAAFANLPTAWKDIDVLVNNAGFDRQAGFAFPKTDIGNISETIGCNLRGAIACTHAVLPGMIARGCGDVVFTGSTAGEQAYGAAIYCGTKAATKPLALALAAQNRETPATLRFLQTAFGVTASSFAAHRSADSSAEAQRLALENTYGGGRFPLQPADCYVALRDMLTAPRNLSQSRVFEAQYQTVGGYTSSLAVRTREARAIA